MTLRESTRQHRAHQAGHSTTDRLRGLAGPPAYRASRTGPASLGVPRGSRRRRALCRLALLLSITLAPTVHAQDVVLDRIVAVVNEAVVLSSDIDSEMSFLRSQARANQQQLPSDQVLRERVVERLIDLEIQRQRAGELGVSVDASTVNRAIDQIAGNNNMDLPQFRETLRAQGFDFDQFRDNIEQSLITQQLIQRDVESRIRVSQQEIDDYIAALASDAREQQRYRVSHILIAVPPSAPKAQAEAARDKADSILQRLEAGEDFAALAAAESDGSQALEGGDLGYRNLQEVPGFLADALRTMQAGDIDGPLTSPNGLHVIRLEDIEAADASTRDQTLVRHIFLTGESPNRGTALARIRQRLQDGEEFAALAAEFSEDPNSADRGGELPWFTDGEMPQGLEEVARQTTIGELSEPFRTQFGWHLLEVLDRRTSEVDGPAQREQARAALQQRKIEQESERWIRQLRDETYIDMKPS